MRFAHASVLAAIALCLAGCPSPDMPDAADAGMDVVPEAGPPTYAEMETVFTQTCAVGTTSCHSSVGRRAGLDMSAARWYAQLVNVPSEQVPAMLRVRPGAPLESYMFHKIEGTHLELPGCQARPIDCGRRMPQTTDVLPDDVRARIREWIEIGAPGPDAGR